MRRRHGRAIVSEALPLDRPNPLLGIDGLVRFGLTQQGVHVYC
jgi:hypothetical protein